MIEVKVPDHRMHVGWALTSILRAGRFSGTDATSMLEVAFDKLEDTRVIGEVQTDRLGVYYPSLDEALAVETVGWLLDGILANADSVENAIADKRWSDLITVSRRALRIMAVHPFDASGNWNPEEIGIDVSHVTEAE